MNATIAPAVIPDVDRERPHRWRLYALYLLAIALVMALTVYGLDYYTLDAAHRPLSAKHAALKPSGAIGLKLGIFGLLLFCAIFLYPLRKRWKWLSRQGSSKHWLDFHVLMGLTAPFIIAFHSSFKFRGFAGMAFWIMTAVALSGVIGRYVYGQIPHRLSSTEASMSELQQQHSVLAQRLAAQKVLPTVDLRSLLRLPSAALVARMPLVAALGYMIVLDMVRPFRVARLRRHALGFGEKLTTFGGLLRTPHLELELAIDAASDQASLSKRILFLSRAERVFHLWHVIHRPFSYSFAVLAVIHIAVVTMMGYVWW
jgi:hypothetical protein